MLHHCQKNHVTFAEQFFAPRLRHQIDALGRATREDDFVRTGRADVLRHALARVFIRVSRAPAQRMQSPMNIRIVVFVIITQRLNDSTRLLRSRSAIKIDQVMAAYLLTQNREILTYRVPIDQASSKLVRLLIGYTCCRAPPYSEHARKN